MRARPRCRGGEGDAASLLPAPAAAFSQQPARQFAARTDALRAGLQELGYDEGRNLVIELRSAEGQYDRLAALAAELVRDRVDVIVTAGAPAIRAAKQATRTVPIVIAAVGDAVAGGLVDGLTRPGGNVTGSTYFAPEPAAKQLEIAGRPPQGRAVTDDPITIHDAGAATPRRWRTSG